MDSFRVDDTNGRGVKQMSDDWAWCFNNKRMCPMCFHKYLRGTADLGAIVSEVVVRLLLAYRLQLRGKRKRHERRLNS